jgi:hypothetical protein
MSKSLNNNNMKGCRVLALNCVLIVASLILSGCLTERQINSKSKKSLESGNKPLPVTVTSVEVVNHQVVIKGTNLSGITKFLIKEGAVSKTLEIESQSSNQLIANTMSDVTFAAGKMLDFILSNAEAASTFTVNFSLCDSTLGGKGFNCSLTPNDKDVLSYDANTGKWKPRAINGLSYQGTWDANDPMPSTASSGDYFIVSDSDGTYNVGDWIVFNGTTFEHVKNSTGLTNVFGRTGAVVPLEGDYVLDKMGDVDLSTVPPLTGDVLKFNGIKWVPGTVITGTAAGSITDAEVSATANIAQSKINGLTATLAGKEPFLSASSSTRYYRGDKTWQTLNTGVVPETVNLYFTNARALGVALTGFTTSSGNVASTDTILQAFGKLQGQLFLKADSSSGIDWSIAGLQTIDPSRLNLSTASRVVVTNGTGALITSGITSTELAYLTGVTSSIQTQLNSKQASITKSTTQDVSKIRVYGANATNYVEITAPTLAANKTLTLPDTDGTNGQVLTTDGTGTLRWSTASGGGGGGGGGTPDPGSVTNTEVSATANIAQSKIANLVSDLAGKQATITAGTAAQYYRGDKTFVTLDSSVVPENTNLYFTNARALGVPLAGFATAATAIVSTDTILQAFGKTQGQINNKLNSSSFIDWSTSGVQTIDTSRLSLGVGNASKAVVTNASGFIVSSATTAGEVGYLGGTTSNIQTQINTKLATVAKTTTQEIGKVRIYGPNATFYTEVSTATLAGNTAITFPDSNGTNGQVLTTDGSGTTRWATVSGGGGGGGVPDPGSVTNVEVSATANIAQSKIANLTTDLAGKEPTIAPAGNTTTYYRGDKTWTTLNSSVVPELTNLYFTNARVLTAPLTALGAGSDTAILATDDVLGAFGKTQAQITNRVKKTGDTMSGNLALDAKLRFKDSGTNYVEFKAPTTVTSTYTLTLPTDVASVAGQVLTSDTSGNLSWTTPTAAGATGTAGGDLTGTYPNPTITALSAAKIGGGTVDNSEFSYLDGVTSSIQTQITGKQNSHAILTGLSSLASTGIVVQTGASAFANRTIAAASASRVTITNGNGVSANPTIDVNTSLLPSPTAPDAGKYLIASGANTASWGTLTIAQADVMSAIGYTPMNKGGDTMSSGNFVFSGSAILSVPTPTNLTDAVNKQYVDGLSIWTKATGNDIYYKPTSGGLPKVGIGTNTPTQRLHVASGNILLDADGTIGVNLSDTNSTNEYSYSPLINNVEQLDGIAPDLPVGTSGSLLISKKIIALAQGTGSDPGPPVEGTYKMSGYFDVANDIFVWNGKMQLGDSSSNHNMNHQADGSLVISDASAVQNMIITSSGNVGIGTGVPGFKLDVNGSIAATGALQSHSDLRLKKNISPVKDALEKLDAITGVYYDWRVDEFPNLEFEKRRQMGVIAQDVEKVFPEAVAKKQDGIRSVAYTMLIAPIIEGVKELYHRILGVEAKQSEQTRKIASLQEQNAKLVESDKAKEIKIRKLEERLERIEKALNKK